MRERCEHPEHDLFPHYGLAPHGHNLKLTGSFLGSTVSIQKAEWPPNFIEDPDEPWMGTYECPECLGKL